MTAILFESNLPALTITASVSPGLFDERRGKVRLRKVNRVQVREVDSRYEPEDLAFFETNDPAWIVTGWYEDGERIAVVKTRHAAEVKAKQYQEADEAVIRAPVRML